MLHFACKSKMLIICPFITQFYDNLLNTGTEIKRFKAYKRKAALTTGPIALHMKLILLCTLKDLTYNM